MPSNATNADIHYRTENHMKIVATEWMSLDGVVQSPSYPTEDPSGGFRHGGWHGRFFEGVSMQWVIDSVTGADAYLLGRGTYDIFAAHWPNAGPEQAVLADPLNARPKYVASSRPLTPVWTNAHRLSGGLGASIAELKSSADGTLLLIGSPGLTQSLLHLDLIDELRIMIDPIIVGSGKRLFGATDSPLPLEHTSSMTVPSGSILTTYTRSR